MEKSIGNYISDFITSISIKGTRAPSTVRNYKYYLKNFSSFVGNDKKLQDLNIELIESWQKYLLDSGKGQKTASYFLIALRSFLRWLTKRGIIPPILPEMIELPRTQRTLKDVPSLPEIQALLKSCKPNNKIALRNRAILELLASSGLRVHELCNLKREDVDLVSCKTSIVGKGGYPRIIMFSGDAADHIVKYLQTRFDDSPYLFTHYPGKDFNAQPITSRSIQRMVQKYATLAGIRTTVHGLRHFFATYCLQSGIDLFAVSRMLGHKSIATTEIYLHYSNNHLEQLHARVFTGSLLDKEIRPVVNMRTVNSNIRWR